MTVAMFMAAIRDCYGNYQNETVRQLACAEVEKLSDRGRDVLFDLLTAEHTGQYRYPPDRAQIKQAIREYARLHVDSLLQRNHRALPEEPEEPVGDPEELRRSVLAEIQRLTKARRFGGEDKAAPGGAEGSEGAKVEGVHGDVRCRRPDAEATEREQAAPDPGVPVRPDAGEAAG